MEDTSQKPFLLAVDPGSDKIGIAVLTRDGKIIEKSVVPRTEFTQAVSEIITRHKPDAFAVGDSTFSKFAYDALSVVVKKEVLKVPEHGSTLEARDLAWKENRPGGLYRILPRIFWPTPPGLDAWAAVVIGRRALAELKKRSDSRI